jgi:hypothetical protein
MCVDEAIFASQSPSGVELWIGQWAAREVRRYHAVSGGARPTLLSNIVASGPYSNQLGADGNLYVTHDAGVSVYTLGGAFIRHTASATVLPNAGLLRFVPQLSVETRVATPVPPTPVPPTPVPPTFVFAFLILQIASNIAFFSFVVKKAILLQTCAAHAAAADTAAANASTVDSRSIDSRSIDAQSSIDARSSDGFNDNRRVDNVERLDNWQRRHHFWRYVDNNKRSCMLDFNLLYSLNFCVSRRPLLSQQQIPANKQQRQLSILYKL